MSSERYGDSDLVYWMGRSINAMTREELQTALGEAMLVINGQKNELTKLRNWYNRAMEDCEIEVQSISRYSNLDYLASFC